MSKLRNFSQTYDLLEDEYSKNVFIRLLSGRIFGFKNVFISPNTNILWKNRNSFFEELSDSKNILNSGNYKLKLFNLKSIGFPIKLYNVNEGIVFSFLL